MQFGMPTLIENRTLEENISLCQSLNLRFIELNMNFPEYQTEQLERTDELIRAAEQAGIYYTVHLDENLNIADFNRLVSDAYLETVRRAVAAAKKLLCLRNHIRRQVDACHPVSARCQHHLEEACTTTNIKYSHIFILVKCRIIDISVKFFQNIV